MIVGSESDSPIEFLHNIRGHNEAFSFCRAECGVFKHVALSVFGIRLRNYGWLVIIIGAINLSVLFGDNDTTHN